MLKFPTVLEMYFFGVLIFISVVISASARYIYLPKRSRPVGCNYGGHIYPPGDIYTDHDGCYGIVCDPRGRVYYIYWDNFYCGQSTSQPPTTVPSATSTPPPTTTAPPYPSTTPPTTTIPPTQPPRGCSYNGKLYPPGEIENGNDGQGWCYGTYCSEDYKVLHWDNFHCGPSTTILPLTTTPPYPSTTPPTTTVLSTPSGPPPGMCSYNGKLYPPGEIENGNDGQGWCFGTYCSEDYKVLHWDNFHCGPSTTIPPPTTTPPYPSTTPPTTTVPSTPSGPPPGMCSYNGKLYPPGEIENGNNGQGGATEHTVARIIRCCIGIISIAGHLPLSPRLPRRPRTQVQPRLQPQFLPLPPVHHQGCAPSTGNFIRPAKSRMGMTARGGASEHTVARIIRCCIGIISIAGHYHIPRFLHLPRRPHTLKHYHIPRSLRRNHKNGTDHPLTDVRNVKDTDFHSYLELTFNL